MSNNGSVPRKPTLLDLLRRDPEEFVYLAAEPLSAPIVAARRLALKAGGKRRLAYIGWIGHRNLGDEAMFDAIKMAFPQFRIEHFGAPVGERILAKLGLGGGSFFDAALLGGGTLINAQFLESAYLVRRFGLPLYALGTGVGSPGFGISEGCSFEGWNQVFQPEFVAVRGPLSRQALTLAGIPQAHVIGDPALAFAPENPPPFRSRNRLILNLAEEPGGLRLEDEHPVFRHLGKLAQTFCRSGGEIVGAALGNGDRAVLTRFKIQNDLEKMRIEDHRRSALRFLDTLTGAVALIGVRLHAAVLACCAGVPPILFAYRSKCEDFMAAMEFSDFAIPLNASATPDLLTRRWNEALLTPDFGSQLYRRALFWKQKQRNYYSQASQHILTTSRKASI